MAERKRAEKCSACRWWNRAVRASWTTYGDGRSYEIEHAQCRRYAPGAKQDRTSKVSSAEWPHVNANDWCGEFASPDPEPDNG